MKTYKYIFACGILIVSCLSIFHVVSKAQAQTTTTTTTDKIVRGWAWSSNIGWISMSCKDADICAQSNYQVRINAAGNLSGYGWSSNIGWVSFNQSDLGGCPAGGGACSARLVANKLEGWGRFLSAQGRTDGWDGWVYLGPAPYSVTLGTTPATSGWAWGSTVVGWTSLSGLYIEDDVTITTINPLTIGSGTQFTCSELSPRLQLEVVSNQAHLPIQFTVERYLKDGSNLILQGTHTSNTIVPPNKVVFTNIPVIQGVEYVFVAKATYGALSASVTSPVLMYTGTPQCNITVQNGGDTPVQGGGGPSEIELGFDIEPDTADANGHCKAYWGAFTTVPERQADLICMLKRGNVEVSENAQGYDVSVTVGRYDMKCDLLAADRSIEKTKSISRICRRNPSINEI